jgi:hypothetical protein
MPIKGTQAIIARRLIRLAGRFVCLAHVEGGAMALKHFVDVRRLDTRLEYRNMSDLLKDFRQYLEREAGTPVQQIETSAALFLNDLCQFLELGEAQRQKVLSKSAVAFVRAELDARVRLPVIH